MAIDFKQHVIIEGNLNVEGAFDVTGHSDMGSTVYVNPDGATTSGEFRVYNSDGDALSLKMNSADAVIACTSDDMILQSHDFTFRNESGSDMGYFLGEKYFGINTQPKNNLHVLPTSASRGVTISKAYGVNNYSGSLMLETELVAETNSIHNYNGGWQFGSGSNYTTGSRGTTRVGIDKNGNTKIGGAADGNYKLLVDGNFRVEDGGDGFIDIDTSSGVFSIGDLDEIGDGMFIQSASAGIKFFTGGSEEMRLTSGGDLHVDGDVIAYSTTISDQKMKDNVETLEDATETVKKLRGVSYVWNTGSREGQTEIGVIAQEVEAVLPFLVRKKELLSGETVKTVDYEKIIGLLIESNKELSNRLDKIEK